jgi:hypothetical protein
VRTRNGNRLYAAPLRQTVSEDRANPHCADLRGLAVRSRSNGHPGRPAQEPDLLDASPRASRKPGRSFAGLRAGCSSRATLEHAQLAILRSREASTAIGPLPRDGLQTFARVLPERGPRCRFRKSIILLTLTAVTLTVAGPLAAAAQQTWPASAPAVFDVADRAAIGARFEPMPDAILPSGCGAGTVNRSIMPVTISAVSAGPRQ